MGTAAGGPTTGLTMETTLESMAGMGGGVRGTVAVVDSLTGGGGGCEGGGSGR